MDRRKFLPNSKTKKLQLNWNTILADRFNVPADDLHPVSLSEVGVFDCDSVCVLGHSRSLAASSMGQHKANPACAHPSTIRVSLSIESTMNFDPESGDVCYITPRVAQTTAIFTRCGHRQLMISPDYFWECDANENINSDGAT